MQHLYKISTVAIALVLIAVVLNYALTTEATIPHDVTTAPENSSDQLFPRNSTNLKKMVTILCISPQLIRHHKRQHLK